MGYIHPTACFVNKVLLMNGHIRSFTCCLWLLLCHHSRIEQLLQTTWLHRGYIIILPCTEKLCPHTQSSTYRMFGSPFTKIAPSHVFGIIAESLFVSCWSLLFSPNCPCKRLCFLGHSSGARPGVKSSSAPR
uniref:Uncharacterized protein n=1 Tax=Rousettus aegyptiacus TaxID=9407 RepID=A0A7J8FJH9_ROUAE|nr:hypothetical protein HJG63_012119 [Rousettus aegyptiacus]